MPTSRTASGQRSRKTKGYVLEMGAAKDRFIELLREGYQINPALEKVGRSRKTYEKWRKDDADFRSRADQAQALRGKREVVRGEKLGFAEFRRKYLKTETFWHQQQWVDILEGRQPRDMHPSQQFTQGKKSRILINTPPFHAKSVTLTVDYVTFRLCMDPSFRVVIVSETSTLAEDFLYAIKTRLDHPDYIELQKAYAPDGGWKATADAWTNTRVTFGGDQREGGEKDPNVQAIGMRSQIYGRRADLIILDDGVTGKNVKEWEKQMTWLRREVSSRLEMGGKLVVVGTRIASVDLYSELMNPEHYANGKPPWTHMASPAILEHGATPEKHVTLWPYSTMPWQTGDDEDECDCGTTECYEGVVIDGKKLYPRWDGLHLEIGPKADNNATEWALVYQQQSVSENATFPEHAVTKSTNTSRVPGILKKETPGYPWGGMHGMYVIAGLDPSVKGYAGIVVYAVDAKTEKRHLLNAFNLKAPTPRDLKAKMQEVTLNYMVNEWRVEKTGLLQFFTQDDELRLWMTTRGVKFHEHFTGGNKWDFSYGVASMAGLFGAWDRATGAHGEVISDWREIQPPLIELPKLMNDGLKALRHQLIIWTPDIDPARIACDLVMALWFAEIGAREYLNRGRSSGTVTAMRQSNRFVSPRSRKNQTTIRLADLRGR